jgi:hypothetical protein
MKTNTITGTAVFAMAAVAFAAPAGYAAATVKTLHPGKRDPVERATSKQQNAYSGFLNGRRVKANLH